MGIQSLTSLVNYNSHLVDDFKLRDTRVVIDGTNLVFVIYRSCRIDCCYGGEYKTFEKEWKRFFVNLRLCNVEPIVFFDGALDVGDIKQRTKLERAMGRLMDAKTMVSGYSTNYNVVPLMCEGVGKNILKTLSIQFYQCAGEADGYIASEANRLRCPVISQDSDFYIFDLTGGYLALDTIEWREIQNDEQKPYLISSIYFLKNLLECFTNLNPEILPLFATLMGNDFVKSAEFSNFIDQIPKESTKRRSQTAGTRRHNIMIGLLKWLQGKTIDTAIQHVLETVKKENREKLRSSIEQSLQMYKEIGGIKNVTLNVNEECRKSLEFLNLPAWFLDSYLRGIIPTSLISILSQRPLYLWTMVEDFSQLNSVFQCCRSIRQASYAILLRDEPACRQSAYEYVRHGGTLEKQEVPYDVTYSYLPSLKSIESIDVDKRKRFYFSVLHLSREDVSNIEGKFPTFLTQFLCSIIFWARSKEVAAERHCFDALVTCLYFNLLRYCIDDSWQKSAFCPPTSESDDEKKFEAAMKKMDFKPKAGTTKTSYKPTIAILHSFSQWQAIVYSAKLLLAALNLNQDESPFGYLAIENIYSGRLCYNLAKAFAACNDFKTSLNKIFPADFNVNSSPMLNYLLRFHSAIFELVEQYLTTSVVGGSRKVRSKKKRVVVEDKSPSVELDGENVEIKDQRETDVVNWSNNKFAALRLL